MTYFITGTDTGVGKTYFTTLLTRSLRKVGFDTIALKPICCGSREDGEILSKVSELSIDVVNPIWFHTPAAPLVAAQQEGELRTWERLEKWHHSLRKHRSVLVEGAGGWLVPITKEKTMAHVAELFGLPILIVVANRLGCLNHTLLTIESIRAHGLKCAGLVLNTLCVEDSIAITTNRRALEEICDVPILFEITPAQQSIELAVA